ncbi:DEAD/DEAH box helicase [Pseudomonas chlororaphis]|nr:DEAD/DEAH box helicase [Pseudomonas chlororaphis]
MQAAAILACSDNLEHRSTAYRLATSIYDLYQGEEINFHKPLRVILTRLENFPSIKTKTDVSEVGKDLPISLVTEELIASKSREVFLEDESFLLTGFQYSLWRLLLDERKAAISAPTSAGKSYVLQKFLQHVCNADQVSVFYLVPTRALIAQVSADLSKIFSGLDEDSIDIVSVPPDAEVELSKRAVYVMTQERTQLLLNTHPGLIPKVVVIDEAHSISDGSRGVLLQSVIDSLLRRNAFAQILFASPMIKNLEIFERLFRVDEIDCVVSEEPAVAQNFVVLEIDPEEDGLIKVNPRGDGRADLGYIGDIKIKSELATRADRLSYIPAYVGKGSINIIYANGADEAERVAIKLANILRGRRSTPRREALAELAIETVHESYEMATCAKKGVAFHYGEVPALLRRAVESAVSDGDIDFLVCTSTLLQGVNLPAKNIFLYRPEKGSNKPLKSTDFWNLAGRAGRLLKEFKGNIFLIDYGLWKERPLEQSKKEIVVPAIERIIKENPRELLNIIEGKRHTKRRDSPDVESVFVKLFSDHRSGELQRTFEGAGIVDPNYREQIESALQLAASEISLPDSVLVQSPNISAHKQQALFNRIQCLIDQGADVNDLLPVHPLKVGAYTSCVNVLGLCHEYLLGLDSESKLASFQAVIALKWMRGVTLPQIIDGQIERKPNADRRVLIRKVLEVIEKDIRFQAVRLYGCYISIIKHILELRGWRELANHVVPISLFLEVGACDKTTISLMSLGLSRVTAKQLGLKSISKSLDVRSARKWVRSIDIKKLGLSELVEREIVALNLV